ncbi:histidinol-phosphate aminotransferase [Candidatus Endobugula sertula]|uniref:Histidinol-phosphate aminotransferase n=1 Tax=Candidatus Endobugula sertula TaxID=62101 RepID=A0A1D2QNJ2_9GAMM|nr:histidinol-phosphate aminotransferase [Candidatus Endobugula sertula]
MSVIKNHIVQLSAYKPPLEGRDPDAYTLLDFNERTIPVGDSIRQALHQYIDSGRLQMYPSYGDIVERLADYAGVDSHQLMITNGSDQGIDLVFRAVAAPGAEAIIPGPSFAIYHQCAKVEAMSIVEPQYTKQGGYPVDQVISAITPQTRVIIVSNPNNPCGTLVSSEMITRIADAAPHAAILIDECYFEFSQHTMVPSINDLPNIFVTRTFSKTWGMPSLRFGYLMSAPENITALCSVRGPYDINQMAIVAAKAALSNPDDVTAYVNNIMQTSKPLFEAWLQKTGIEYWSSAANYLWCFPECARDVGNHLQDQGFLVRPKMYGDTLGLRITIGIPEQMKSLMAAWEKIGES